MNVGNELRAVKEKLNELWKLVISMRASGGTGGGTHNLLSNTHPDTTTAAPTRGDIVTAQGAPALWKRLAKAAAGRLLGYDANDVVAIDPETLAVGSAATAGDADTVDGSHAAAFAAAAHHAQHESGGGDGIKLDDLAAPDDNTDLDVSITKHGLAPKAPNDTAKYLRGDGTWATVSAGASNVLKLWRPDAFPTSPAAQCDHFDDASLTGLTAFQAGGALSVAESDTFLKYTNTGDNAYLWRGHFKALPAGDFTIVCRVSTFFPYVNYLSAGLCLFEDATNNPNTCKLYCWTREHSTSANVMTRVTKLNNYASYSSTPADFTYYADGSAFLRIRRSGTTLYFDRSTDGLNWVQQFSEAQWFTPAEFGFIIWNYSAATTGYAWFDFLFYKGSNDPTPGSMGRLPEFWIT